MRAGPLVSLANPPTVAAICRYPVKGLGGERLESTCLSEMGVDFDRTLALPTGAIPLRPSGTWTTYDAFHTLIGKAELARSTAKIVGDPAGPDGRVDDFVEIAHPDQGVVRIPIYDSEPRPDRAAGTWAPLSDADTEPVHCGVPLWDVAEASVSIINLATIRALSEQVGVELDPTRFRANIYLEGLPEWHEFDLIGRHLRVGDAEVAVFAPIERCRATSARPGGSEWDVNVPGALASHFGHIFCGLYARVTRPGFVSMGDPISWVGDRPLLTVEDGLHLDSAAPRRADVLSVAVAATGIHSLVLRDPTGLLAQARAGQYLRVHGAGNQPIGATTPSRRSRRAATESPFGTRVTDASRRG